MKNDNKASQRNLGTIRKSKELNGFKTYHLTTDNLD